MRTKEEIQKEYSQLCTQLGQLVYRAAIVKEDSGMMLQKLDEEIQAKKEKIRAVNQEFAKSQEPEAPKVVEAEVVEEVTHA